MTATSQTQTQLTEHFLYLDDLRESGATNMMGAAQWLRDAFGLGRQESYTVLEAWMKSFDGKSSAADRAAAALAKAGA